MITDMTSLMILLIAAALLIAWTLRSVAHDDRGRRPPPASHLQDRSFVPPTRLG